MRRFKQILCVLDYEKPERASLERAVELADNNQAQLTVIILAPGVRAFNGMPGAANLSKLLAAVVNDRMQTLQSLLEPYRKRMAIESRVLAGTPFLQIIREVLRNQHDLVIKSPDHQDFVDRLFGSNDMHLLRKCPCPVWLIKSPTPRAYRCILAAVDVNESYPPRETEAILKLNRHILELSSSLAIADSAELHIVHAWDAPGEGIMRGAFLQTPEEQIVAYAEQIRKQRAGSLRTLMKAISAEQEGKALDYLKPQTHLMKGWASKEIPSLARRIDADLVVMGTVARTGIPGFFMGNTAETILNQVECSVLAVKPPGFITPVTLED